MRTLSTLLIGLVFSSPAAYALDEALDRATTALGQLNSWQAAPGILLRHCQIHVPAKAPDIQGSYDAWRQRNAHLLEDIASLTEKSLPIFTRLLGMTPGQARAWQADSVSLGVEEAYFWRKGRVEIHSMCTGYSRLLDEMEQESRLTGLRARVEIVRAGLARAGVQ